MIPLRTLRGIKLEYAKYVLLLTTHSSDIMSNISNVNDDLHFSEALIRSLYLNILLLFNDIYLFFFLK